MYYPIGWPKKLKFPFLHFFPSPPPPPPHVQSSGSRLSSTSTVVPNGGPSNDHPQPSDGTFTPSSSGPSDEGDDGESDVFENGRPILLEVASNSDRSLFVIMTDRSIHVWYSRPAVEIVTHVRNASSLKLLGHNRSIHWKPDSTMMVIKTTMDMLIFYKVVFKSEVEFVFEQTDLNGPGLKRESAELIVPEKIPALYLLLECTTQVTAGLASILAAEEEVVVATKKGDLIGINWDGTLDPNFRWDLSDGSDGFQVIDIRYSSMIGGFAIVFRNGRMAFMPIPYQTEPPPPPHPPPSSASTSQQQSPPSSVQPHPVPPSTVTSTSPSASATPNHRPSVDPSDADQSSDPGSSPTPTPTITSSATTDPKGHTGHHRTHHTHHHTHHNHHHHAQRRASLPNVSARLQFVPDSDQGVTSAINHKYLLMAFGLATSEGILCVLDEEQRVVQVTHRLVLPSSTYPDAGHSIGPMRCMHWSPDSCVLATSWDRGGVALWSVFGSLLMCSLGWDWGLTSDRLTYGRFVVSSLAWSREGYQLWFIGKQGPAPINTLPQVPPPPPPAPQVPTGSNNIDTMMNGLSNLRVNVAAAAAYGKGISSASSTSSLSSTVSSASSVVGESCVMQLSLAKSILASNPSAMSSCRESLLLVSEDRLFLGIGSNPCGPDGSASSTSPSPSPSPSTSSTASNMTTNRGMMNGSIPGSKASSRMSSRKKSTSTIDEGDEHDQLPSTNQSSGRVRWEHQPMEVGSHQWIVIQIPFSYLCSNWPIRLASMDKSGQHLAVAGRTGFAHYSLSSRRWKLFGNESQERDFEVCGGLVCYENHVIVSCFNLVIKQFELRAYPMSQRLDNMFMHCVPLHQEVLALSMNGHHLLSLEADGTMTLFMFVPDPLVTSVPSVPRGKEGSQSSSFIPMVLIPLDKVALTNLTIPPECVISLFLTSLHLHPQSPPSQVPQSATSPTVSPTEGHRSNSLTGSNWSLEGSAPTSLSILMNVCGRVFLFEREDPKVVANLMARNPHMSPTPTPLYYKYVAVLATGVENIWVMAEDSVKDSTRPHLTDALWLGRGCHGMSVWLPLFPPRDIEGSSSAPRSRVNNHFISRRIMLPIKTHIYPLAVLFRDAVVIGAENDTMYWNRTCPLSYSTISRTSQVYLHHILKELLKKNLGLHAWDIANTCCTLPYFPHSLELLLHETLEEEATSSQPIPDALLPRVVDFIRSFPVFLQTVVHCARKTELALWPHLFDIVGNPRDLFQSCLDQGLLTVAASYLLVLQTMERSNVSRKYALLLLEAAKEDDELTTDLTRFLDSIHPSDFESPPPKSQPHLHHHPHHVTITGGPVLPSPKFIHSMSVDHSDGSSGREVPSVGIGGRKRTSSNSTSALSLHSPSVSGAPTVAPATASSNQANPVNP